MHDDEEIAGRREGQRTTRRPQDEEEEDEGMGTNVVRLTVLRRTGEAVESSPCINPQRRAAPSDRKDSNDEGQAPEHVLTWTKLEKRD